MRRRLRGRWVVVDIHRRNVRAVACTFACTFD